VEQAKSVVAAAETERVECAKHFKRADPMGETFKNWKIGDVEITRLVEVESLVVEGTALLPLATRDTVKQTKWLAPHFVTPEGELLFSFQCFLVRVGGHSIVVDTCIGNHKPHPEGRISELTTSFLRKFEAAGAPVDAIRTVLCTHLHFDHVGWNTRFNDGKWVPTFPNARYLFGRTEWDFAREHEPHEGSLNDHIAQSVTPIFEASQVDLVETDHRICDEISLEPTPGHTPGHVSVWIESKGEKAVITGDLMHHPIQCAHPRMASNFCYDGERANATRESFLERVGGTRTLVIGSHFAGPTAGRIVCDAPGWKLEMLA
jgi:glyoxylase-like metal-dependent hydrolase (beta-lactamase superfamily II)